MRSKNIQDYIEKRESLFWYTPAPKSKNVTDALLVETILNYGTMDDVRELFILMGIKNVAKIFFDFIQQSERCRGNYFPSVLNYFTLYFNRYAR